MPATPLANARSSPPRAPRAGRPPKPLTASWTSRRLALNVLSVVIVVLIWHAAAVWQDNIMFPTPLASFEALIELLAGEEGREQLAITLGRVVVGFALGSAAGIVVGSVLGSLPVVATALEPVVHFLRSVTPVAWIVPATIWLGVGEASLRFIVIYATVFPVILNTLAGMAAVPRNKIRMARMFGAGRLRIFGSIVLPGAVPYVATGMRLALGYSFMSVVAAEMIAGNSGMGFLIYRARIFFDTPTMFAGIVLLGISGLLFDRVFVIAAATVLRRFYSGQAVAA